MISRILAIANTAVFAIFVFGNASAHDLAPWFPVLIWGGVILSIAAVGLALAQSSGKTRLLLIVAGIIGAVSLASFRLLPLGSINIAGFGGAIVAMVLFLVAAVLPERFSRRADAAVA
ncbi:hypothetical protein ACUY3K_08290 [Corynebacterium uberis]|uniref:hypothetical protein n=1 Tax=Corynebacterium TaxID=1716 RepID=UPI001D0B6B7C|nr:MULTISPECIES: hypothetical protein [Corynebacterium]MCZ9308843.1 hypothetical protein [Corynebacterium sp. c6VSa_13]UDL72632.1 hypothetical protein LH391_05705 [Corynebacterium uberis]UDL76492.1 hypothetical protein LH393_03700 [Corynebacterium uberis]UDL78704.1 hypothetical protein LH394_03685 [Corynebacterium uberis]UDL80983.1 hypothetical protein LH392_04110 [Corynebacterium uberis]